MPSSAFSFHPDAEAELEAAAEWYDEREPGLGLKFLAAVRATVTIIVGQPQRWRLMTGSRRALLGRFPYAVVYRELNDHSIEIVAIAHFKRRPHYWAKG